MLARRRLPSRLRGRVVTSWMGHPSAALGRHVAPIAAAIPSPSGRFSSILQTDRRYRLSTAAAVAASSPRHSTECGSAWSGIARPGGGVRWVSRTSHRAAKVKVAHGARRDTPAIPSFIEIRYAVLVRRKRPLLLLLCCCCCCC